MARRLRPAFDRFPLRPTVMFVLVVVAARSSPAAAAQSASARGSSRETIGVEQGVSELGTPAGTRTASEEKRASREDGRAASPEPGATEKRAAGEEKRAASEEKAATSDEKRLSPGEKKDTEAALQRVEDADLDDDPVEPDFTLVNLPTALRLPRFKVAFRVTHRFNRPLNEGDFGSLVEDLFGLDSGGRIGLELRFGLMSGLQVGAHRTNDRTIELFSRYNAVGQDRGAPLTIDPLVSVDGTNNFRGEYSPAIGAVLSRAAGDRAAFYLTPMVVFNSNLDPLTVDEDEHTFMVGLGARVRITPNAYLVAEVTPRVAGFRPGDPLAAFAIERRVGGHSFQLNFSNGLISTPGQMARGVDLADRNDWFIGFNISRKFY